MRSVRAARPPATASEFAKNLERVPASADVARQLVTQALVTWDLLELSDAARLVVTELVSNAIRHAQGEGIRVVVTRLAKQGIRVAVIDRDRTPPQMRKQSPDTECGRGLVLIAASSTAWDVDLLPGGKRVYADLEAS